MSADYRSSFYPMHLALLTVGDQLEGLFGDHMPFVMEAVHVHTEQRPGAAEPILFLD